MSLIVPEKPLVRDIAEPTVRKPFMNDHGTCDDAPQPEPRDHPLLFVVGSIRSGTTMVARILGGHPDVFACSHELHFFEQIWTPQKPPPSLSIDEAQGLAARLLSIHRNGNYRPGDPQIFSNEAQAIVGPLPDSASAPDVFSEFLRYESDQCGKKIACDHTPRNVFYIRQILDLFPHARVIHVIRDPRDVLLSQKQRRRRKSFGEEKMPWWIQLRFWLYYHPVTNSLLWNRTLEAAERIGEHTRVLNLKFEDLLTHGESKARELFEFAQLKFHASVLDVPQLGSSHQTDQPSRTGIDASAAGRWRRGGLNRTEIYLCERTTQTHLNQHQYETNSTKPNPLVLVYYAVTWPLKAGAAVLLNLRRLNVIWTAVRRVIGG